MAPARKRVDSTAALLERPRIGLVDPFEARVMLAAVEGRLFGSADPVTLGRYRIEGRAGHGAGGFVYRGHDPGLDRAVAIKVFRSPHDGRDRPRFHPEAEALAGLSHPHVVDVFDVFTTDDACVAVVMEWVEGMNLERWIADARPSISHVIKAFMQLGDGLAAVHAAGWVHRDVKPANVLVGADGRVRLADFGLARARGTPSQTTSAVHCGARDRETRPARAPGTPAYMAPEALAGGPVDARADQYSFCVSLFEALHGELPAKAAPRIAPHLPRRVRHVLARGLARDSADRFPSMEALLRVLGRPSASTRARLGAVAVILGLVGSLAAFATPDAEDCEAGAGALEEVWTEARGVAHQRFAGVVGRHALARLDHDLTLYAESWAEHHRQSCDARLPPQEAKARRQCLAVRRTEYEELVGLITSEDGIDPSRASTLPSRLEDAARCVTSVDSELERWIPGDPEQVASVRRLRERLAQARARSAAGRYDEALALLERVRTDAEAGGFAPLVQQARSEIGSWLVLSGDVARGVEALTSAYEHAIEHGFDLAAASVATDLTFAVGYSLADHAGGLRWARHAQAILHRLDIAGEYQAQLDGHLGSVETLAGNYDRAERLQRRAERIRRAEGEPARARLASTLNNLGNIYVLRGQLEDARRCHEEALEIRKALFGPLHPLVATSLNNLASVALQQGQDAEAEALLRASVDVWEQVSGADHRDLVHPLQNLSTLALGRDAYQEAEAWARRAQAIANRGYGSNDPRVAMTRRTLGAALHGLGHHEEALFELYAALRIARDALGEPHEDVAAIHHVLSGVYLDMHRPDAALPHARAARSFWLGNMGPGHLNTAAASLREGKALLGIGEVRAAKATLEALVASSGLSVLDPDDRAVARSLLAEAAEAEAGSSTRKTLDRP